MAGDATVDVKGFSVPDESRKFLDGSERKVIIVGKARVGRGVYLPGWRWSAHVQPMSGRSSEAHTGYVVSGQMKVLGPDGTEAVVRAGEAFYAAPGADAWVLGNEPCVALDFEVDR